MTTREAWPQMAPEQLVAAWEDAYRGYSYEMQADFADVSLAVATAWRALAESTELPWWLSAAVRSAAEAFERQGEACLAKPVNGATISLPRQSGRKETGGGSSAEVRDQDADDDRRTAMAVAAPHAGTRCTCSLARSQVLRRAILASADTMATTR